MSEQGGMLTHQWKSREACSPQSTRVGSGWVSVLAESLTVAQVQSPDLNKPTPRCQQTPALPTCRMPISWGRLGIHM